MSFSIGPISISNDTEPKIIAELGINHGGSLDVAKKLASLAIESGADIVKTQTHLPRLEMSVEAEGRIPGNAELSIFQVISENSLSLSDEEDLARFIRDAGGTYLSTPFSREAADFLIDIGVEGFKIGSGECNNYPFVDHVASKGLPVILSTGMNTISEVEESVAILKKWKVDFALLHTTNLYPTPTKLLRLGSIQQLMDTFPGVPIGLSDHSTSNSACLAATANGASILERHFTDSRERVGPDIVCSMTPTELSQLRTMSREIFLALGGDKSSIPEEDVTRNFAFASVASLRPIRIGEKFTSENIFPIRPAGGDFPPSAYWSLLGKRARRDIPARKQIGRDDV